MSLSLIPRYMFSQLTDLTPAFLQTQRIRLLLMDFDNTMLPYSCNEPAPVLLDWIADMRRGGVTLCVVSNSKRQRVPAFCAQYGLPCVTHAKKPFPRGIHEALRRFQCERAQAALVGDQIYTDVLGANGAGIASILVRPIHLSNIWLRLRHVVEQPFIALGRLRAKKNKQSSF